MSLIIGSRDYINSCIDKLNFKIISNKYGKPIIVNKKAFFNKSHEKDLSVAIIEKTMCGIDIEKIKKYNNLMVKKICSESEIVFLNNCDNKDYYFTLFWVLKESYLKCIGIGLSYPMSKISFVRNGKIVYRTKNTQLRIMQYKDYLISICRKDL